MSLNWKEIVSNHLGDLSAIDLPSRIQVPRPPQCIAEFLQHVDRPDSRLETLAGIIEKDTEIAASVLRIVNGSQLMLKERISSVSRAIGILGVQRCKMLVMSAAIQSSMNGGHASTHQASEFLLEAQIRSLYGRRLAELLNVDADIVYIASLLQDLILPNLLKVDYDRYQAFQNSGQRLVEAEQEQLRTDHGRQTGGLLAKWNFADPVIACVALHHAHELILNDQKYLKSELAAVAITSLLPGVLNQEPQGIAMLMEYQHKLPEFDFLQVATDVDEQLSQSLHSIKPKSLLADRLGRLAIASMEERNKETNWVERSVGSYTLEEKLGQGGMGVVYRARHSMLRRPAAVKMLKTATLSAHVLEQFEVEANITSELSSPHTVQVYDYGMTPEGELYYVMEFLQGKSLAQIVAQHGPLPEERIIHILCQVCGSLAEAHAKGLIHRDIKPENIALTVCAGAYDFAKVLDFGLVAVKDEIPELAQNNKLFGTPAYMAPEAIQAADLVDERTDIYALGAVAYFCLTGKPLFHGNSLMDILKAQIEVVPDVPIDRCTPEFAEVILACLEKSQQSRPQTVMEVVEKMGRCSAANEWTFQKAEEWWSNRGNQPNNFANSDDQSTRIGGVILSDSTCIVDSTMLESIV